MAMHSSPNRTNRQCGFTLIELIMIIVILGILSAVVYVRWPVGMEEAAAAKEFKRAVRYAQHKAMTRQYDETAPETAWGIKVADNRYTVQRQDADCLPPTATEATDPDRCAEEGYRDHALNDDNTMTLTGPSVWFNGLGEPINSTGAPLTSTSARTYTIGSGTNKHTLTLCPATGYLKEGDACP